MRSYDEPIEVRLRASPSAGPVRESEADSEAESRVGEPESFRWRGRTYAVQGVVDSWVRSRPWWRYAMDRPAPDSGPSEAGIAQATRQPDTAELLADLQEVVWRVEAAKAGGAVGLRVCGVYDLVCTGSDRWRLLTVLD